MQKKERRLITAALPYTNNVPHIGNIVGSHLPADIFARYCRLKGYDTIFVGGTDEHGTATEISAQKFGITPKELCDFFYIVHKKIYDWFEMSYDSFSRTSKPIHHSLTKDFFKAVYKKGFIVEKELELPYCNNCQRQLSDRFIEGICPYCGYEKARGDQCESCSKLLDPINLKEPKCAVCHGSSITFKKVKHIFLDLEKLSPKIEKWVKSQKAWRPQVRSLALAWVTEGLKPRCISRDLKWGINIPLKGYEDKVFYCWFEAPLGYISSTMEVKQKGWKNAWTDKKTKIYHFIGKDNIPFHTIFFPGLLLAHGSYNLPYDVVGLQYLNYERVKFSKSQGIGVFCDYLPESGLKPDYWRFYLSFIIPETKDTEFLWNDFQERINKELVGNLGNFVNRTLSFVWNKYNGEIPKVKVIDKAFQKKVKAQVEKILDDYEKVELRYALEGILKLSDFGNEYFQKNEPWKGKGEKTVFLCLNLCKIIALLAQPYIPNASSLILDMLNSDEKGFSKLLKFNLKGKIKKPALLFKPLETNDIKLLKEKTSKVKEYFKEKESMKKADVEEQLKEAAESRFIDYNDFKKLDLRVGTIKAVKGHPEAERLYILLVKFDEEPDRQIVASLKGQYKEEELIGKQVVVLVNLKPAVIRGVESNGMLLAAVNRKDQAVLVTTEKPIDNNSKVL